jgi:regulation of enolase protein 1 (concanavalin A-like superfamily)
MLKQSRKTRPILPALWAAVLLGTVISAPARAQLPANWQSEDVGTAKEHPGSVQVENGIYTIGGAGNDVWGTADGFRFTYTPLQGDGSVIARVLDLPSLPGNPTGTAAPAKAGVMIRESIDPGARHLSADQMARRGVEVTYRLQPGGATNFDGGELFTNPPPLWLRVQRVGTTFTAFASTDGQLWTQLGESHAVEIGASALAGLVVSAVTDAPNVPIEPVVGRFDNVSVINQVLALGPAGLTAGGGDQSALLTWNAVRGTQGYNIYRRLKTETALAKVNASPVTDTTFRDSGLTNGSQYVYAVSSVDGNGAETALSPVSVVTPAPLNGFFAADVGMVTAGAARFEADTFTVRGAGRDIGGTNAVSRPERDEFRFVFQPATGDTTIVARLKAGPNPPDLAPKAGLMIRESLDPTARFMTLDLVPNQGLETIFRTMPGFPAASTAISPFESPLPIFLRLERQGDVIRASASADGQTWRPIGSDQLFGQLSPNLYVGLVVNGHQENAFAEAQFDSVRITH